MHLLVFVVDSVVGTSVKSMLPSRKNTAIEILERWMSWLAYSDVRGKCFHSTLSVTKKSPAMDKIFLRFPISEVLGPLQRGA